MRVSPRFVLGPVLALLAFPACAVQHDASSPDDGDGTTQNEGNVQSEAEALGTSSTPGIATWASRFSMGGYAWAILDDAADGSGGVVVLGRYGGQLTIDPATGASTTMQTDNPGADWDFDTFLARFDASGALSWIRTVPFTGYEPMKVAADPAGGIVLLATHAGDITFAGCPTLPRNNSNYWPFLAKLDAAGTCKWIRDLPHSGGDQQTGPRAVDVTIDGAGNVLVAGRYSGQLDFGGGVAISGNNYYVYVAKLGSADGTPVWARTFGDPSTPPRNPASKGAPPENEFGQMVHALAADAAGNVTLVGNFYDTIAFDDATRTASGKSVFVVRYDSEGNENWSRALGTDADVSHVAMMPTGEAVVGGTFLGDVAFGTSTQSNTGTSRDVWLVKYDATGRAMWSKRVWGSATMAVAGLAFDSYGQTDVAVAFGGGTAHVGGAGFNTGNARSFIAKLGVKTGGVVWSKPYGVGTTSTVTISGLAVSPTDEIYAGGAYGGSPTLGSGGVKLPLGPTMFVARFMH